MAAAVALTPTQTPLRPSSAAAAASSAAAAAASSPAASREETEAAVARLHAAGDDVEALTEALAGAAFLESTPGDARQKLRAARLRLRTLLDAAKRAAAGGVQLSPHAKEAYEGVDFDRLSGVYDKLSWRMISKPGGATVKPDDYYRLYALTMQAMHGDVSGERPMWAERGGLDFEGRAKWDAWAALRGLPSERARLRYVKLLHEFGASALYKDTRAQLLLATP